MIFPLFLKDKPLIFATFLPLFKDLINSTIVCSPSPLIIKLISGKSTSDSSGTEVKCIPPTTVIISGLTFFAISTVLAQVYALHVNPEVNTIEGSYDSIYFSTPSQLICSA